MHVQASTRRERAALVACVVLALALRLPALWEAPWIDEVWSWGLARSLASWSDVFTPRTSNNHVLVTLWMRVLGDRADFVLYRLPSLVAGVASAALAFRCARREGTLAATCAGALVAVSFLLSAFSTEARGYSIHVAASLALFLAARAWLERRSRGALVLAWVACAAGVLAQLLFVTTFAALAAWIVVRLATRRTRLVDAALLCAVPCATFAAVWFVHARHLVNSGAPPWDGWRVVEHSMAWGIGGPVSAAFALATIVVCAAAVTARALRLARDGRDEWVFLVAITAVVPFVLVALLRGEYLAPRYFLAPLAFVLVALGSASAAAFERGGIARVVACGIVLALCAGNAMHHVAFARIGKSAYARGFALVAAAPSGSVVRVTGNQDFNVGAMVEYFQRAMPSTTRMRYVQGRSLPKDGVDWIVVDAPDLDARAQAALEVGGRRYELAGAFENYGPFGTNVAFYRRR